MKESYIVFSPYSRFIDRIPIDKMGENIGSFNWFFELESDAMIRHSSFMVLRGVYDLL